MTARPAVLAATLAAAIGLAAASAQEPPALPDDFERFMHVHSLVIADEESPLFGFHHFYLGETGRETFRTQAGFPYPEGTTFLGAVYGVATDGAEHDENGPLMWTLMRKDRAAEETGGWAFAAFEPDGSYIEQDEASACFECHTGVSDTDYVFSRPLDMALPRP